MLGIVIQLIYEGCHFAYMKVNKMYSRFHGIFKYFKLCLTNSQQNFKKIDQMTQIDPFPSC